VPGATVARGIGYTGEWQNPDGTVFLRARVYHPALGRFLQRDSFAGFSTRPTSLNRYSYAEGNPISATDPSGHFVPFIVPLAIATLTAAAALPFFFPDPTAVDTTDPGTRRAECAHLQKYRKTKQAVDTVGTIAGLVLPFMRPGALLPMPRVPKVEVPGIGPLKVSPMADAPSRPNDGPTGTHAGGPPDATPLPQPVDSPTVPQFAPGRMAPDQVTPGTRHIRGTYDSPSRSAPEPYSAHYDEYGRQIGRTDYTAQPDPKTHTDPHYHTREYGPGYGPRGKETGPLSGLHPLDRE